MGDEVSETPLLLDPFGTEPLHNGRMPTTSIQLPRFRELMIHWHYDAFPIRRDQSQLPGAEFD